MCGNKECSNKKEAKKYFKENLSYEIKINKNKDKKSVDLIKENKIFFKDNKKNIKELEKKKKSLAKAEKREAKRFARLKDKQEKKEKKEKEKALKLTNKQKKNEKKMKIVKLKTEKKSIFKKTKKKSNKNNTKLYQDNKFCLIKNKCDIDEIAEYYNNLGTKKPYPDITNNN